MKLMAGLAVLAIAGCGGAEHPVPSGPGAASAVRPGLGPSAVPEKSISAPRSTEAALGTTPGAVRAAAAHFENLYFAGEFAASWALLTRTAQREVPRSVWVGVHAGCSSASAGVSRAVKSVTLFGSAAIITEVMGGARQGTNEYIFNYSSGAWRYSPADLSIYQHRSVSADITATKAAGLCVGWRIF